MKEDALGMLCGLSPSALREDPKAQAGAGSSIRDLGIMFQ